MALTQGNLLQQWRLRLPETWKARSRSTRSVMVFSTGNLFCLVLRLVGGVLVARATQPATLGLFNAIALVQSYLPFLQLGVSNGLNRQLPYLIGKGDNEEAKRFAACAQMWSLVIGISTALMLAAIAIWYALAGHWLHAAGWATNAIAAFHLFYILNYLQLTYRTSGDFEKLAGVNTIENSLGVLLVPAVYVMGFYGLCVRKLVSLIVSAWVLFRYRPLAVAPRWHAGAFWSLMKVGAPIFAVGQLWAWWVALDATLVLRYMGTTGLGLYTLSTVASSSVFAVATSTAQVVYPAMAEEYGRTGSVRRILRTAVLPTMLGVAGTLLVAAVGWIVLPAATHLILPQYTAGIPAARWAIIAGATLATIPPFALFNVVRRQDLYGFAIVIGLLTYLGTLMWLIRGGPFLAAFPIAMLAGYVTFSAISYLLIAYLVLKEVR